MIPDTGQVASFHLLLTFPKPLDTAQLMGGMYYEGNKFNYFNL